MVSHGFTPLHNSGTSYGNTWVLNLGEDQWWHALESFKVESGHQQFPHKKVQKRKAWRLLSLPKVITSSPFRILIPILGGKFQY
jgi:hypothetical protein